MSVLSIHVAEDDAGLGNIDVLLGLVPRYTLEDVLCESRHLSDIILQGPAEIQVLPAGSGLPHLTALTDSQELILQTEWNISLTLWRCC